MSTSAVGELSTGNDVIIRVGDTDFYIPEIWGFGPGEGIIRLVIISKRQNPKEARRWVCISRDSRHLSH